MFIWEVGWDVCRDETFFIPGLHENVSTWDDFTRDNLHNIVSANQASIISSRQSGTECLHDKNCPRFSRDPSWANRDPALPGRNEKRPGKHFHIKTTWWIWQILLHGEIPFNVPSRQTSRLASHIDSPLMKVKFLKFLVDVVILTASIHLCTSVISRDLV